jgi:branched-subunit amino acid transport protein
VDKLLIFFGMAAVTYFTRYAMIALLGREMPSLLRRWLSYVPAAVLAALITPAALAPRGPLELGPHLWAAAFGAIIAWRTRSMLWPIVGGMAVFWLARAFGL